MGKLISSEVVITQTIILVASIALLGVVGYLNQSILAQASFWILVFFVAVINFLVNQICQIKVTTDKVYARTLFRREEFDRSLPVKVDYSGIQFVLRMKVGDRALYFSPRWALYIRSLSKKLGYMVNEIIKEIKETE